MMEEEWRRRESAEGHVRGRGRVRDRARHVGAAEMDLIATWTRRESARMPRQRQRSSCGQSQRGTARRRQERLARSSHTVPFGSDYPWPFLTTLLKQRSQMRGITSRYAQLTSPTVISRS